MALCNFGYVFGWLPDIVAPCWVGAYFQIDCLTVTISTLRPFARSWSHCPFAGDQVIAYDLFDPSHVVNIRKCECVPVEILTWDAMIPTSEEEISRAVCALHALKILNLAAANRTDAHAVIVGLGRPDDGPSIRDRVKKARFTTEGLTPAAHGHQHDHGDETGNAKKHQPAEGRAAVFEPAPASMARSQKQQNAERQPE